MATIVKYMSTIVKYMSYVIGNKEDCFSHDDDLAATGENLSSGFLTRSDTNQLVQSQKKARSLKFWI